mgnify:CR=1 FL=1
MLPNMASSKSARASILPSPKFSFPFQRSASPTPPSSSAASEISGPPSRSSTGLDETLKQKNHSGRRPSSPKKHQRRLSDGEPVPPRPLGKAKTWGNRISSIIPSLMSNSTDTLHKKTMGDSAMAPPPPPPDTAPPPPPTESKDQHRNTLVKSPPPVWRPSNGLPISASTPALTTELPNFSFSTDEAPQINNIPPSPEMKRAILTKQEPAAKTGSQRSETPSSLEQASPEGSPKQIGGKLRKENTDARPRRNSLQQAGRDSPQLVLPPMAGDEGNLEARGRRSISAQQPVMMKDAGPGSRVSSLPIDGSSSLAPNPERPDSPGRGRNRRSWFPGGRSRANSADVKANQPKSFAWVMSDDAAQAEYNPAFLRNGDKVRMQIATV